MALSSGTKLGPYEIQSLLGAGGMGEVYRARDTRLGRDVAIKILPPHLSSNPDLRERFEREARAISSLNHPRICTLHDIGHQDGISFLVMEYVQGWDSAGSCSVSILLRPVRLDKRTQKTPTLSRKARKSGAPSGSEILSVIVPPQLTL